MVSVPNPPGSRQSISPFVAVFEIAPAKVLQGAVRLHGLASLPTPDTQVRVACAFPGEAAMNIKTGPARRIGDNFCIIIPLRVIYRTVSAPGCCAESGLIQSNVLTT